MSPSSTPAVSQPSHSHKIQKLPPSSAPPGFVKAVLDDQAYLIPKFLVPAVFLQINQQRPINEDITVNPGPREETNTYYDELGGPNAIVDIPPDPQLSGREALQLHAEIEALMERENLTYPAAARQLYYAEVSKLEAESIALNAFTDFRRQMDGKGRLATE